MGVEQRENALVKTNLHRITLIVAPATAFVVAWATSSVREDMGIANIALVLAAITTAAALTSWVAGVTTSIVAALSLNYFHTEPVHSLRITAGSDLLAVGLLCSLGIGVSIVTALRVRHLTITRRVDESRSTAADVRQLLMHDRPVLDVWDKAVNAAAATMALLDVRLEPRRESQLPVVSRVRSGHSPSTPEHDVVIPDGGAIVQFRDPRHPDQLVLTPRLGMGAISTERRAVLAFADHVELAIERAAASVGSPG